MADKLSSVVSNAEDCHAIAPDCHSSLQVVKAATTVSVPVFLIGCTSHLIRQCPTESYGKKLPFLVTITSVQFF